MLIVEGSDSNGLPPNITIEVLFSQLRQNMENERNTIIERLSYLNGVLGYSDRVSAICPHCHKKWNKKPQQ